MPFKLYEDIDWLRQEYVIKKRTAKQIAEVCSVTEMTIYNWLLKFDLLKLRGKGRKLGGRTVRRGY